MTEKRRKTKYLICFMAVWTVLMAAAFYFCTLKQGFHEDEYYTYYSTARTNGFYVEDGKWMDSETYRKEFVVLPGERFQYGLVKQVLGCASAHVLLGVPHGGLPCARRVFEMDRLVD